MRTVLEILSKRVGMDLTDPEAYRVQCLISDIEAAMKEAREEYAKYVVEKCYQWHEDLKLWVSVYHAVEPDCTEDQLIEMFDKHLEEERGKNES